MKKIIPIILIILGCGLIATGIYLQLENNNSNIDKDKKETKEENKKQENNTFTALNEYNLPTICSKNDTIPTYINRSDYSKVTFDYPSCVHEYELTFYSKVLSTNDYHTRMFITVDKKTLNNYMNEKYVYLVGLKNEEFPDIKYTNIYTTTTKNNLKASIIQANYSTTFMYSTTTFDTWYIAVELEEELILTFQLDTKGNVFDYENIMAMIDSVKLEKDAAIYAHSKLENGYQIGTIKQNKYKSYEHGYKLNYKVKEKYPEIDSLTTNINSAVFEKEELNYKMYANLSIETENYEDFKENVEKWKRITISSYNEDPERYRNIKDTGIIEKVINNKKVYYFIYTYDYYLNNKKSNTNYISRVQYEIEPNTYVDLWISNTEVKIDEAFISDFLDFTIEEY
ncbi:MAG: hypothetical protein E7162_05935 [Firmicutes bacterium]|nr:hypothetical protein [Bacillota bacterium]